jgi:hypothetical protein
MAESAIKPEIVDIVDNSFKGGLRKSVKEIIKSLEDGVKLLCDRVLQ